MPEIVTDEEWLVRRRALLLEEKALTRARDALNAKRRALPWRRVARDYTFDTEGGCQSLVDLFGPHSQLVVQHFMFGTDWDEGCPSCSFWADGFDGLSVHLAARDVALVVVAAAPLEKLLAYRQRMGWDMRWVSALGPDFNRDFGVGFTQAEIDSGEMIYNYEQRRFPATEAPGISVFKKLADGSVAHTYSTYARGLDMLNAAYHLIDLTPDGRNEAPGQAMKWLRRHDQY